MNLKRGTLILAGIVIVTILVAGCSFNIGKPAPASPAEPVATQAVNPAATTAAPVAAATTPACPDKEVLTGSWDSREVGYASNHDVREAGVWNDASPVPVTLTQKCWDATGTFMVGACPGTLTGKIEKNVFSGKYTLDCANSADSSLGTFSVTMASDNRSFMGSMYKSGGYGPERGYPPSWWGKKTA
jgi:hypothetical protein